MKTVLPVFLFMWSLCPLEALSLRFQNQTTNFLTAEILGANGSFLGEVQVPPQKIVLWSDASFPKMTFSTKSVTPMTVYWFDGDGELFCTSDHVMTGSLLQTNQGIKKKSH